MSGPLQRLRGRLRRRSDTDAPEGVIVEWSDDGHLFRLLAGDVARVAATATAQFFVPCVHCHYDWRENPTLPCRGEQ
jgi:hypothetical protein